MLVILVGQKHSDRIPSSREISHECAESKTPPHLQQSDGVSKLYGGQCPAALRARRPADLCRRKDTGWTITDPNMPDAGGADIGLCAPPVGIVRRIPVTNAVLPLEHDITGRRPEQQQHKADDEGQPGSYRPAATRGGPLTRRNVHRVVCRRGLVGLPASRAWFVILPDSPIVDGTSRSTLSHLTTERYVLLRYFGPSAAGCNRRRGIGATLVERLSDGEHPLRARPVGPRPGRHVTAVGAAHAPRTSRPLRQPAAQRLPDRVTNSEATPVSEHSYREMTRKSPAPRGRWDVFRPDRRQRPYLGQAGDRRSETGLRHLPPDARAYLTGQNRGTFDIRGLRLPTKLTVGTGGGSSGSGLGRRR